MEVRSWNELYEALKSASVNKKNKQEQNNNAGTTWQKINAVSHYTPCGINMLNCSLSSKLYLLLRSAVNLMQHCVQIVEQVPLKYFDTTLRRSFSHLKLTLLQEGFVRVERGGDSRPSQSGFKPASSFRFAMKIHV